MCKRHGESATNADFSRASYNLLSKQELKFRNLFLSVFLVGK